MFGFKFKKIHTLHTNQLHEDPDFQVQIYVKTQNCVTLDTQNRLKDLRLASLRCE